MAPKIDEVYPNGSSRTDDRLGPGYSAPIHGGAESGKVAPEWLASMTREEDPKKKKKKDEKRRPNEPAYEATSDDLVLSKLEENKPNNPKLWSRAKSLAKQKFDVYPSAYANGWAAKWYKSKGGKWKSAKTESHVSEDHKDVLNYNRLTEYSCNNCPHEWETLNSLEGATECWNCGGQGTALGLVHEDLRKWFGKGKKGGHGGGGWDRYNTKGERVGKCAREEGESKPKCLSREKAAKMSKKEIAAAVKRKRKKDPVADRRGKGKKPVHVSNKIDDSFNSDYASTAILSIDAVLDGTSPDVFLSEALPTPFPKKRRQSSLPRKMSMLHPTVKHNLDKRAREKSYKKPEDLEVPKPDVSASKPKPKFISDKESSDKIVVLTRDDHPETEKETI